MFLCGLCKSYNSYDFVKIVKFFLVCFLTTSFASSLFSLFCLSLALSSPIDKCNSRVFGRALLLFFTVQVIPSISNMWNLHGFWVFPFSGDNG